MIDSDTSLGGGRRRFDTTQWSQIVDLQAGTPEARRRALEDLIARYWKPVYAYVRLQWGRNNEDSKDLTQQFLSQMLQGGALDGLRQERGRFRSFLKVALRNFMTNTERDERRIKRGGDVAIVALQKLEEGGVDLADAHGDPAAALDLEWKRALVTQALERLRETYRTLGREKVFEIFKARVFSETDEGTRDDLARELGVSLSEVKNSLVDAGHRFRSIIRDLIAETVTDDEGLRIELKELFGEAPQP